MNRVLCWLGAFCVLATCRAGAAGESTATGPAAPGEIQARKAGDEIDWPGGRKVIVKQMDVLPLVESEYSKLFQWDTFENPKLKKLREQEKLDEVVKPGKDEFDRMVRLLHWAHHRFPRIGNPDYMCKPPHVTEKTIQKAPVGALEILANLDRGATYGCIECAQVMVNSLNSMGYVARVLALKKAVGVGKGGNEKAQEHTTAEVWSNQHRKWVLLDAKYAVYHENKAGLPLNAWELRQEWFYNDGNDLVMVFDNDRKRKRKADLPIARADYKTGYDTDTYDLAYTASNELDKYAFIGYVPNTGVMDEAFDYTRMVISQDKLCEGTTWLRSRRRTAGPAVDPYFPINQAALTLTRGEGGKVDVRIRTLTPNFKTFQVRIDGKDWAGSQEALAWTLHDGANKLEARSVNRWDVAGPVSTVELELK